MKIGFLTNSNNFPFVIVRYLRDRGIEAELLLTELEHEGTDYHPSKDTLDDGYLSYTKQLDWGASRETFFTHAILGPNRKKLEKIKSDLSGYDMIAGSLTSPAYMNYIGRKLDIFIPMGADTRTFPFYKFYKKGYVQPNLLEHNIRAYYQKRGIENALNIWNGFEKEIYNLDKLNIKGTYINEVVPVLYEELYNLKNLERISGNLKYAEAFREIRRNHELIVFHHCRLDWELYGNDMLIKGYADFVKKNPEVKSVLILFERGNIPKTKALVNDLDIGSYVTWMPLMSRVELMYGLSLSDIGASYFNHSWLVGGCPFEIYTMGKPNLQNRKDELYSAVPYGLPPIMNVGSPEDVTTCLQEYIHNKAKYEKMGQQAQQWHSNVNRKAIDKLINLTRFAENNKH